MFRWGWLGTVCALVVSCGRVGYEELDMVGDASFGGGAGAGTSTTTSMAAGGRGSVGATTIGSGGSSGSMGGVGGMTTGGSAGTSTGSSGGATTGGAGGTGVPDSGTMAAPMFVIVGTASKMCLDVPLSATADGVAYVIAACTAGSNQLFRFIDAGGGAFNVVNVNSGKCIDFQDATGALWLAQRTCAGAPDQVLTMQSDGGNSFALANAASSSCVGVRFGSTALGSPVEGTGCDQTWTRSQVATGSCIPESDAAFCARLAAACDKKAGTDNCGSARTAVCGPCTPLQQACGAANTCSNIGKTSLAQGGTITASNPGAAPTDMTAAFDGNAATKWFPEFTPMAWIAYQVSPSARYVATSYAITSAPDWPDTDPADWIFEGSNNGNTWTTLDTRTNQVFVSRQQTNLYSFTNITAYNSYRLNITRNNGSVQNVHLGEIQIFP